MAPDGDAVVATPPAAARRTGFLGRNIFKKAEDAANKLEVAEATKPEEACVPVAEAASPLVQSLNRVQCCAHTPAHEVRWLRRDQQSGGDVLGEEQ